MNIIHAFVSPNVTQIISPASDQYGDSFDMKLQYLVDSVRENSQYREYEELEEELDGSSPSSIDSFSTFIEEDMNTNAPNYSIEIGLPSPEILDDSMVKSLHSVKSQQLNPNSENTEVFVNPVLTPLEPLSYDWKNIQYQDDELSTFSRVLRRTEDIQLPTTIEGPNQELNSVFQNQFISQEIYPQVITTDILTTPTSNSATSLATASPSTPGSTLVQRRKVERKKVERKKKARLPRYTYDESAKPIAQQLVENKKVWNKLSQKKKKGIYKCTHCPETFGELIDLAKHIDENKIARQHKCPFEDCPWSIIGLPRRAEVRRHCAAQHAYVITYPDDKNDTSHEGFRTVEKFKCKYDFCDRFFKRKDSQQRHEKLVHLNPSSRFNKRVEKLKAHYNTDDVAFLTNILDKNKKLQKVGDDNDDDE